MAEKLFVHSAVPKFLARQRLTVADLVRRMQDSGFHFDKKTIYRLASDAPMRSVNLPAVVAIGRVLKLNDPGKLIDWSQATDPSSRLQRIDAEMQARLDDLMGKNTEGLLTAAERREFRKLGQLVEKLSLENARLLASHESSVIGAAKRRTSVSQKSRRPAVKKPVAKAATA